MFAIAGLGFSVVSSSCVVAERRYVSDINVPPRIVIPADSPYPLTRVIRVAPTGDGGLQDTVVELRVQVYDTNIEPDNRFAHYLLLDGVVQTGGRQYELSRPGAPNTITLRVSTLMLPRKCHRVELRVSREFATVETPREPGDVANAVWWLALENGSQQIDMRDCPQ